MVSVAINVLLRIGGVFYKISVFLKRIAVK
jgi:hypothetical protein